MEKLSKILKECDIRNVLKILTEGLPKKKYSRMLERYYSLYCMVVQSWFPDGKETMVITSFKQTVTDMGEDVYQFYGVRDSNTILRMKEETIDWEDVINSDIEVLIPECLTENIEDDFLVVEILCQLDQRMVKDMPRCCNKTLFENVRAMNKNGKNAVHALEKIMELRMHYQCDKRCIEAAIVELMDRKGLVVKWGDILVEDRDPFLEKSSYMKNGRELLASRAAAGCLPPVYEYFYKMDVVNSPDLTRCYERKKRLESEYEELELSDYQKVVGEHMRIVLEDNPTCGALPLVFIRDKYGEKQELLDVSVSKLLCMDICVTAKKVNDAYQVLAILLFYLEYPLRVKRMQKEYMILSILGMKMKKESIDFHSDTNR